MKVGFVGLGAMGEPMAGHLAKAGHLHTVWNRTHSVAQAFAAQHASSAAADVVELARDCDLVALCVSADQDVLDLVVMMAPHLSAGALVVDHSTVAPETATSAAAILAEHGAGFLDAPISGGVEGARNGQLSVMVGGDPDHVERAKPVFDAYAARISHMGPVGNGQATKAVNQVLVAGIAEAVCEGLALAESLNLPRDQLLNVLRAGAAGSWFLDKRGSTMLRDDCDVGFKLALLLKDLHILRQLAQGNGLHLAGVEQAINDYSRCVDSGDGDQDISALIRLKRKQIKQV